jgi:nicotinamide mononucleotide adenylyltransferase
MAAADEYVSVPFLGGKLLDPELVGDAVPVVIATCGAYNPIHTGHLAMFEEAKRALESGLTRPPCIQRSIRVVGGFLSPVNDAYGKAGLAPFADRRELCEAALADNTWITCDAWEGQQRAYVRSYVVLSRVQACVKAHYASIGTDAAKRVADNVQLVFVCGADLFESFYKPGCWELGLLQKIFTEMLILVFRREGSLDPMETIAHSEPLTHKASPGVTLDMKRYTDRVCVLVAMEDKCASSTLVRKLLGEGASVSDLVPRADVLAPLLARIYGAK